MEDILTCIPPVKVFFPIQAHDQRRTEVVSLIDANKRISKYGRQQGFMDRRTDSRQALTAFKGLRTGANELTSLAQPALLE